MKNLNEQSEQLLLAIRKQEDTTTLREELAKVTFTQLRQHLTKDEQRLAFWINVYNAYFLYLRRDCNIQKPAIYRHSLVPFADLSLSLDEVEHGILRRCRAKWALGFLPSFRFRSEVRQLMVDRLDARIHFALNCGAQSCPSIAFYHPSKIDEQLAGATTSFLTQETKVDEATRTIQFTKLGQWYLGDFGGRRGILRMLQQYIQLPAGKWRICFQDYNWSENLDNFA